MGVGRLCRLFGKTRHAYYDRNWFLDEREQATHFALEMVAEIRREIPRIGSRKLHFMLEKPLEDHKIKMGRDMLHPLLVDHGLTVKSKRRYIRTTDSNHWLKKYPNLIKNVVVKEPERVWVSDITYIIVEDGFNFLNLITDVYSKKIMGHCLHPTLEAEGAVTALKIALNNREKVNRNLIHHSDRGTQYCSMGYVSILQEAGIKISMTENGDPYENAIAERINGILKQDFDLGREFSSREKAIQAVNRSIRAYNEIRPHMSCDYLTPDAAHQVEGDLKRKWKPKVYNRSAPAG